MIFFLPRHFSDTIIVLRQQPAAHSIPTLIPAHFSTTSIWFADHVQLHKHYSIRCQQIWIYIQAIKNQIHKSIHQVSFGTKGVSSFQAERRHQTPSAGILEDTYQAKSINDETLLEYSTIIQHISFSQFHLHLPWKEHIMLVELDIIMHFEP